MLASANIAIGSMAIKGKAAMTGTGRKIVYVMLVIVVLLVIWQILASF